MAVSSRPGKDAKVCRGRTGICVFNSPPGGARFEGSIGGIWSEDAKPCRGRTGICVLGGGQQAGGPMGFSLLALLRFRERQAEGGAGVG